MADTVDLTSDDTEPVAVLPPAAARNHLATPKPTMSDEIDLTEDSPRGQLPLMDMKHKKRAAEGSALLADNDDFHRKRIMSFANAVSTKRQRVEAESIAPALAAVSIASNSPARKLRRTQGPDNIVITDPIPTHSKPDLEDKPAPVSTQVNPAATDIPAANQLLAQLHAERVARQKAREAGAGGSASQPATKQNGTDSSRPLTNESSGKEPVAAPKSSSTPQLAAEGAAKGKRRKEAVDERPPDTANASSGQPSSSGGEGITEFDLLTYNIWFSSDAMSIRMKAIGGIVKSLNYPAFICLQEVTTANLELLRRQPFWHLYDHSPLDHYATYFTMLLCHKEKLGAPVNYFNHHFPNSVMGRSLLGGGCKFGDTELCISTVHLESPCNGQKFSQPRKEQLQMSLDMLDGRPEANTLVAGDTNWNTDDGPMVLKPGWHDAWVDSRPGEDGYTYHCRENPMLMGSWPPQRFDRILYKMRDWEAASIQVVGNTPIPNATYMKQLRNGASRKLQVLPSDHYGVVAKFVRKGIRIP